MRRLGERIIGQRYGKLSVISYDGKNNHGLDVVTVRCDCGNEKQVLAVHVTHGSTKACGCLKLKHGHARKGIESRTFRSWQHVLSRCTNPNNTHYNDYGGRGIRVCDRWYDFLCFLEDMGECAPGLTIERIDNDKGYYKENCKWATRMEQAQNRRNTVRVTIGGISKTPSEWARASGLSRSTIEQRIAAGWPQDRWLIPRTKHIGRVYGKAK